MAEKPSNRAAVSSCETAALTLNFDVFGEEIIQGVTVPIVPRRPRDLLPVFVEMIELIMQRSVERALLDGRTVSCQAGCGACCRQLVPITCMEAHHIRHYVLSLPQAERRAIQTRFATAKQRLQETGLVEFLRHPTWDRPAADHQKLALAYFRVGVACPFLVDESCSIHPQRPIVCREYLVTSPSHYCSLPERELIDGVERSGTVSRILAVLEARTSESKGPFVPLTMALDWASVHAEPGPGPTSVEIFDAFFNKRAVWPNASVATRQRKRREGKKRKRH